MTDNASAPMSNETLRKLVETMVEINDTMKEHRKQLKLLNKTYKTLNMRVKEHMRSQSLEYIDLPTHQVHTYSRIRPPPMNAEFMETGLAAFFKENKLKVTKATSAQAAQFLAQRKKDKVGGTEVWSTTVRAAPKKKVAAKRGKKRKQDFAFAGSLGDSDPQNMNAEAPDPARPVL
jgi:hypothetical protein